MTGHSYNVARYLPEVARSHPEQPAVVIGAGRDARGKVRYRSLSFAELERESSRYAWGLSSYGIGPGMRVLLMVRPGLPLIGLTFALFKIGCVPILIDPAMGRRNLLECIAECEPEALIGVPRAQLARRLFPGPFRSVRRAVTVGPRLAWDGATLDQLRPQVATPYPSAELPADAPAAIIFTTGSTGRPKGVIYEHGMFDAQLESIRALYGLRPGEVEMPAFPLFALFNVALGVTTAVPPIDPTRPASCDPAAVLEFVRDQQVTSTFGSPAIWNRVTRHAEREGERLPTLRRVMMAGAPVPLHIHERFHTMLGPGADTYTPYGATEALPVTSISGREVLAAMAARDPLAGTCVGRAAPGMTLRIIGVSDEPIDRWDDALALPAGQVGEIVVRGPVVTRAYIARPEATRLAKIADGDAVWHRMGDVGYLDAEGRLWFYGRKSHRVVLPDRTLYTEPVELIFNQHADVARSALVGVRRAGGVEPAVVIQPVRGRMPKRAGERERFAAELLELGARYEMTAGIQRVLFHPSFPVDIRHNAKIFREQLAAWAEGQPEGRR